MIESQNNNSVQDQDGNSTKPLLAVRYFEIDFNGNLKCRVKISDGKIEIEAAMNGWGDGIPVDAIDITEL